MNQFPPAELVNITETTPNSTQIWGFHNPCNVNDVKNALNIIALGLIGPEHTIHIMSGTHGYCKGQVGAVATREEKFAKEDLAIVPPKTQKNKIVALEVHDFNINNLPEPDYVTAAMAKLNKDMQNILHNSTSTDTFLLAYCCSAGTK